MIRTALVTGGTRGIGLAIGDALCKAGFRVAAVYRNNVQAAQAAAAQTGMAVFQWDVADCAACMHGIAIMGIRDAGSPDRYTRITHAIQMRRQSWTTMLQSNEV